jgi:hypothetical protein
MSQIVPWNDPGEAPCCCIPICTQYVGPDPELPEPSENDATFTYPPPFVYAEGGFFKTHPDLYDLSVIDISPTLYATLVAGGVWSFTSLLQADIQTSGASFSVTTQKTSTIAIENICEFTGLTLATNDDDFSFITYIDRQAFFHPTNTSLRKAKIAFAPEIRKSNFEANGELYPFEFYGCFWPIAGTNDPARQNTYYGADLTINVGGETFSFDETDGFRLVQSLWYSDAAHLTVTATMSPSAP